MKQSPIIVDLDGTLIHTDTLHESLVSFLFQNPFNILKVIVWLLKGKAGLKYCLAKYVVPDPDLLPYNDELVTWLENQRSSGKQLILCTGANKAVAEPIAQHLGFFDEVIASDKSVNLTGKAKAKLLAERFGKGNFQYAGNSAADLLVWAESDGAIVANASQQITSRAGKVARVEKVFHRKGLRFKDCWHILRVHQWSKNLLLFVPVVAGHRINDLSLWPLLMLAFIAFSFCASAVYIINDLHDMESDRKHARKRNRPFASGAAPIWLGWILAPVFLLLAFSIGLFAGTAFLQVLFIYFVITFLYSFFLKSLVIIDCVTLSLLYTLRIIAGAAVVSHTLSFWLMAFSVFLFLSLAFVKRYSELSDLLSNGANNAHGRGYQSSDISLVQTMGISAGFVSVLVLALYLNSEEVLILYQTPQVIWGAVPIILFWVSWIWFQAHRGNMHDDPLVFALLDRTSLCCGILFLAVLAAGTAELSW